MEWSTNIYIGLDVHKQSWTVAIVTLHSSFKSFTQPPKPEVLAKYLRHHFPNGTYHCVYEAGYCGYWIHEALSCLGIECMVINPADVPTTDKEKKHKTNKVDARKLARSLRNGDLHPIFVPSHTAIEDRTLVRSRYMIVRKQTRCKNQIKALLSFYGITVPDDIIDRHWSARYIAWLQQLTLQTTHGTYALQLLLSELALLRKNILDTTRMIRALSGTSYYAANVSYITSISGISTLVAMILLTEIVTIKRFCSLDHLAGFVGLVPGEESTGDEQTLTGLTERKNRYLRWILTECAWVAVRNDEQLSLAFNVLCQRMPKNKAIIRIARKILNRIHFALKHQQPCLSRCAA